MACQWLIVPLWRYFAPLQQVSLNKNNRP